MNAGSSFRALPAVILANHQSTVPVRVPLLERHLAPALDHVLAGPPGPGTSGLGPLEELEVSLVSDAEIARQHAVFLGDASPTDVITFEHGELLLSADTAAREARDRGAPVERELLLYAIHGFLHLHGYLDAEPTHRNAMHQHQNRILESLWPE